MNVTKFETDVCNADSAMCKFLFIYMSIYIDTHRIVKLNV